MFGDKAKPGPIAVCAGREVLGEKTDESRVGWPLQATFGLRDILPDCARRPDLRRRVRGRRHQLGRRRRHAAVVSGAALARAAVSVANATNTVALWPGSLGSAWGYRRELRGAGPRASSRWSCPASSAGLVGRRAAASDADRRVRPPGAVADPLCHLPVHGPGADPAPVQPGGRAPDRRSPWLSWTMLFQLLVALYGGYFGAGIGILMLAALEPDGPHRHPPDERASRTFWPSAINGIAAVYFVVSGLCDVDDAAGDGRGRDCRRRRRAPASPGGLGRRPCARVVVAIGFGDGAVMLLMAVETVAMLEHVPYPD